MPTRDAITGHYVTEEYAKAHPDTTVKEESGPEVLERIAQDVLSLKDGNGTGWDCALDRAAEVIRRK